MPRRSSVKHAAKANAAVELTIDKSSSKTTTYLLRTSTALYAIFQGQDKIKVEDIITRAREDAEANGETLGPRAEQSIHLALSKLQINAYIRFLPHRDDVERITLTPNCKTIFINLDNQIALKQSEVEAASSIQKHRAICTFFGKTFRPGFKPSLTRRQLDLRNRELELEHEEYVQHRQICPILRQRSPSVAATEILPNADEVHQANVRDSFYVDDVPQMTTTPVMPRPQTPVRRSSTLNNPEAYPSPESVPRNLVARPTTPPSTPSRGGSRSPRTPSTFDQDPAGFDDDDMVVDTEVPGTSNVLFTPVEPGSEELQSLRAEAETLKKEKQELIAQFEAEKTQWRITIFAQKALFSWSKIRIRALEKENQQRKEQLQAQYEVEIAKKDSQLKARQRRAAVLRALASDMEAQSDDDACTMPL